MSSKLLVATCIVASFLITSVACKKETAESISCTFDQKLLDGGTWTDLQNGSAASAIKFRFYENARVTFTFKTASYPSLKYDSFPDGRYELVLPDTLRLYDRSWNYYGYLQVVSLSNTELRSRMPGYNDVVIFKREN